MSKRRVLIADDDPDVRRIFSDYLTHAGYAVQAASNGDKALELATQSPPDLALVDVMMPGPSGMTLAVRLMELDPAVQIIIITAYGSLNLAIEVMQKGAFCYLVKPIRLKQLSDAMEMAWQARAQKLGTKEA